MASNADTPDTSLLQDNPPAVIHRRRPKISFRRRRIPTVRLGGKKPRKGLFLVRLFRRIKMKSLKLKYFLLLKKLKAYYQSLVKDMIEGAATFESFQQRVLLETSFAVPAMGFTLNSLPPYYSYMV